MNVFSRRLASALVLLLFSLPAFLSAQTIRGFITNDIDGLPLQSANVVMRSSDGEVFGTATDSDGYYILARVPPGTYTFQVSFIGFQTWTETIELVAGDVLTKSLTLISGGAGLDEVVVEAEAENGAASVTAGLQTIRPADIDRIPVPDVSGDLASYLTALPGVVTEGDRGGQFFVRGGTGSQNLILLDNMLIYQPFHILGFYSAFPSDIINKADIYAGGFGARFGGRISSVIDVGTRNGNKRQVSGAVSVAPFVLSGRFEAPLIKDKVSVLASVRQSVVENIGPTLINRPLPYRFGDQFVKVHATVSESSQASVSVLRTYDKGLVANVDNRPEISLDDPNLNQVQWKNEAYGVRYLLLPAQSPVSAEILLSYSRLENSFGKPDRPDRSGNVDRYNLESNLTYYLGTTDINAGFFLRTLELEYNLGGQYQNFQAGTEFVTEAGAYMEADIGTKSRIRVTPGLRLVTFPRATRSYLEPRFRFVWFPDASSRHKISGAAGLYHQEITGLNDRRDAGDVFTAWSSSPLGEDVPTAIHGIVGWQFRPRQGLEMAIEGYYKDLKNLAIAEWTAFPRFTTALQAATGTARGVDARLEFSQGPLYIFASYGLSKVQYKATQESLLYSYGTTELEFSPPHDRRHQGNIVTSLTAFGLELNVRWQFGAGLPFTQAVGFDDFILMDGRVDLTRDPGNVRVLYDLPYRANLPDYHRLDLSLERRFNLSGRGSLLVQAGLLNAYDRPNLFYIDLFSLERVDQLPLIPTAGLKLELR